MTLDAVRAMPHWHWLLLAAALKRRGAAQERALRRGSRSAQRQSTPTPTRRLLPSAR